MADGLDDDAGPGGPPAALGAGPGPPGGGGPPLAGPPSQAGNPIMAALAARARQPAVSSPGPGNAADSLMMLKQAVDLITQALPGLGAGSQQHTAAVDAIRRLARHLPQGAPVTGVQQTQLQDQLRMLARNAILQRVMANRGQGAPAAPGGAGPMPSPAMPGA